MMLGITIMRFLISLGVFGLLDLQYGQLVLHVLDLLLRGLGLVLLALAHQHADLLADLVALGTQIVRPLDGLAVLFVQVDHFVHQGQLGVLELLFDVLRTRSGFVRRRLISIMGSHSFPQILISYLLLYPSRPGLASKLLL